MCWDSKPDTPDPGQSALNYVRGMADPGLQNALLGAEKTYRPQYAENNVSVAEQSLFGFGTGQRGWLDILGQATPQLGNIQSAANTQQREADLADVEQLGGRATEAILNANPQQRALVDALNQNAMNALNNSERLSFEANREAEQGVRQSLAARGRSNDNIGVFEEALNRESLLNARQDRAQALGLGTAALNQSVAGDPFQAILGRPSNSLQSAMGQQQASMYGAQTATPSLINPDTGVNLAQANYATNVGYTAGMNSLYGQMYGAGIQGFTDLNVAAMESSSSASPTSS